MEGGGGEGVQGREGGGPRGRGTPAAGMKIKATPGGGSSLQDLCPRVSLGIGGAPGHVTVNAHPLAISVTSVAAVGGAAVQPPLEVRWQRSPASLRTAPIQWGQQVVMWVPHRQTAVKQWHRHRAGMGGEGCTGILFPRKTRRRCNRDPLFSFPR